MWAIIAVVRLADWIARFREDLVLMGAFWKLLRRCDSPSPLMRVKLTTAQAMLAALRAQPSPALAAE